MNTLIIDSVAVLPRGAHPELGGEPDTVPPWLTDMVHQYGTPKVTYRCGAPTWTSWAWPLGRVVRIERSGERQYTYRVLINSPTGFTVLEETGPDAQPIPADQIHTSLRWRHLLPADTPTS
jgi:hypothetical protein